MLKKKNLLALSLAVLMMAMPLTSFAKAGESTGGIQDKSMIPEIESSYIKFEGEVVSVNKTEKSNSITIQKEDTEDINGQMVVNLGEETKLFDTKEMKEIEVKEVKKGSKVDVYVKNPSAVTASMPPIYTSAVIVLKNDEVNFNKVDKFDENLLSSDGGLKLNVDDETEIFDLEGNKLNKESLVNATSIVYYTITTYSLPPQTPPKKIIVIEEPYNVNLTNVDLDKIIIEGKEIELEDKMIIKEETLMIPVRQVAEALGYTVTWNHETFSVEFNKMAQWTTIKVGENKYTFAKMAPFELELAPELIDAKTYVPFSFLEEVFRLENIEMNQNNIIEIK